VNKIELTRLGRRGALASALGFATVALAAGGVQAAAMIGNCELYGQKGAFPFTPAQPGQLTVEVNLPAPGWWNGDTPDSIKDGYEYCMAANIAHRAGLDKVKVVNVAWRWSPARPRTSTSRSRRSRSPTSARRWSTSRCPTSPPTSA
jgi:hypothetical protein